MIVQKNDFLKSTFYLVFVLLVITFFSCQVQSGESKMMISDKGLPLHLIPGKGQVCFYLTASQEPSKAYTLDNVLDMASGVLISIISDSGEVIKNLEFLPLYKIKGIPVTPNIALKPGNYKLTDFMVFDKDSNTLFATPKENSDFANYVDDPLPIDFTINAEAFQKISPDILPIDMGESIAFGYAGFGFKVINLFSFYISVFNYNPENLMFQPTEGNLIVKNNDTLLYSREIKKETNRIFLKEGHSDFNLIVEKEGYKTWSKKFTIKELNLHDDKQKPILVHLFEE